MRCGRCGNDNAEANRFCGMCGAALVAKTQSGGASAGQTLGKQGGKPTAPWPATIPVPSQSFPAPPVARQAPAASPAGAAGAPVERRPVLSSFDVAHDDEPEREPIISGPSFLGLNKPAAKSAGFHADGRGGGAHEHLRSSGNVDYLLEDEEEPKRIWGKVILFLVALVLACGFGYLRWKQGGFDWLTAAGRKPAAAQTAPNAGQNGTDKGGAAGTAAAPDGAVAGPGTTGAAPATASGVTPAAPAESAAAPPQTAAAPATPTQSSSPPATGSQNSSTQNSPTQNNSAAAVQTTSAQSKASDVAPASAAPSAAGADSDTQSSDEEQPAAAKAASGKVAASKPAAAKPSPAKPVDPVAEAERYIYGSGLRQDCDRGLRMLKTAAGQSDAKAMISLGALYSTGTCAPRDLPTAYRWFALALHKQPDNQPLQEDLQKVWGQMTQPERQLAIKLSQ